MEKEIEIIKSIDGPWMKSTFFPPAHDDLISDFENKNKLNIPSSYKEFLKITNGAKLFGGDVFFYGVGSNKPDESIEFNINYDFSEGRVPNQLLIIGFYNSSHICYDKRSDSYILYEYEEFDEIEDECCSYSKLEDLLNYMIDIATN